MKECLQDSECEGLKKCNTTSNTCEDEVRGADAFALASNTPGQLHHVSVMPVKVLCMLAVEASLLGGIS